jgi:hypothetical protein
MEVEVGAGVWVVGTSVGVEAGSGTSVALTPQADNASPAEVVPANLRKSLRENSFLLIVASSSLFGNAQLYDG